MNRPSLGRTAVRRILPVLGGVFAIFLLAPQAGQAPATLDALHHVRWSWLPLAGAAAAGTYVMAAVALRGAATQPLTLGRTCGVQLAAAFTNRITPAGLGGMATNVRYLETAGSPRPAALAAVGLNSAAGFVVHLVGLLAVVPLLGAGRTPFHPGGPDTGDSLPYLLALIAVPLAAGMPRWGRLIVQRCSAPLRSGAAALADVLRRPHRAAALFGGSAGLTLCYAIALAACTRAFGLGLGLPVVIAVFLGGAAVGSVSAAPGGLGAVEGALVAGLTAAGAASGPAIAAVLTYRLITYWLPVIPGFVAYRALRRRHLLTRRTGEDHEPAGSAPKRARTSLMLPTSSGSEISPRSRSAWAATMTGV